MRIIPKKTKVKLEFFKGVEVLDVVVGLVGGVFAVALFMSDLPGHIFLTFVVVAIFVALLIPFDDDKVYMSVYHVIKNFARHSVFVRKDENEEQPVEQNKKKSLLGGPAPDVKYITPFTGVKDNFIEYGGEYYGVVVEVPSIEFRFYTEARQNNLIDKILGSILRTVSGSEAAEMVKIDRPVIYDNFLEAEEEKIRFKGIIFKRTSYGRRTYHKNRCYL